MVQPSKTFMIPPARRNVLDLPFTGGKRRHWSRYFDAPAHWDVANVITESMLDRVEKQLTGNSGDIEAGMKELLTTLWRVKSTCSEKEWEAIVAQCVSHPIRESIHQDPFASRCFTKPRGYAGDAVLIDFLYTRQCMTGHSDPVSDLGKEIFHFTRDIPAGHAVRKRRDLMATVIDEVCAKKKSPHILSVACGHLREAALSAAVTSRSIERFIALDQDELSLATVESETAGLRVTAVHNSIKALFRGPVAEEKFDLIYSTGLYDYLDDRIATKLTGRMFEMLNPGGRVVIANFVPNLLCSAYMEALLDWKLVYRDLDQVRSLATAIPTNETASVNTYLEENGNIAFLDVTKH
jgi:extracellular factor (EF) 3-hydroxypalmitic acid methyl ester biosynthesis protein